MENPETERLIGWPLPPALTEVLAAIRAQGRPILVGGCVRDRLLGFEPKDFDVEVYGVPPEILQGLLRTFGKSAPVGRSFGVIKLRIGEEEYDFAIPRRERKTGAGHRGFSVDVDPELPIATALARRDFTINSIAWDPHTGEVLDPHRGLDDLAAKILRHTSSAFVEDPLRVLRAMQFAARFDLRLAPETAALCSSISASFAELPVERGWGEWQKWALSRRPSAGLRILRETGWIAHFPELAALVGVPQDPQWHPEGDVFAHTSHCVDALASLAEWRSSPADSRRDVMFATLAHDFGKPSTTEQAERNGVLRWVSPGHEPAGGPLAEKFLIRLGAPKDTPPLVRKLVENHMAHLAWPLEQGPSPSQIRRLARRLAPATIEQLMLVLRADHLGRPPRESPDTARRIVQLGEAVRELVLANGAPRPLLLGRHLIAQGFAPGDHFRAILDAGFEAQLDGRFHDEAGACAWLIEHMKPSRGSGR